MFKVTTSGLPACTQPPTFSRRRHMPVSWFQSHCVSCRLCVRPWCSFHNTSEMRRWIFSRLSSVVLLGTEMNWLIFGVKGQGHCMTRYAKLIPSNAAANDGRSQVCRLQWSSGNMPDWGVRRLRFESHRGQLHVFCKKTTTIYSLGALGTGCTPLLQCLGRLSLLPSVGW